MKSKLLKKFKRVPKVMNKVCITQKEFDSILFNPELTVVEKHIHNRFETQQVLFVIKNNEIDFVAVKEIIGDKTTIWKEVENSDV